MSADDRDKDKDKDKDRDNVIDLGLATMRSILDELKQHRVLLSAHIEATKQGFDQLHTEISAVRAEIGSVRTELGAEIREVRERLDWYATRAEVASRAQVEDLEQRVRALEARRAPRRTTKRSKR